MALPSSAIRVASSSSETTSSPRSGFSSNGDGTRRGAGAAPDIGGTLATAGRRPGVGRRRFEPQPSGGAADAATPTHLGAPGLAPGHAEDPLDGRRVGRVGAGEPGPHGPAGQRRRGGGQGGGVGGIQLGGQGGQELGVVGQESGGA